MDHGRRLLLTGTRSRPGFFDKGNFIKYLAARGKSAGIGGGRRGVIPMAGELLP
jgi:hypothetical protein